MSTTTPKPPQPPPFFSYTPASLVEAAANLNAASGKVWDAVAGIPPQEATFANAIQPLGDDENARAAQGRILYFLSTASPDKEIRAASKEADVLLKRDVIERCSRADVFAVVDAVSQRPDVKDLPAESQVYMRRLWQEFVRNGLAVKKPEDRARLKEVNMRLAELHTLYTGYLNADVDGIWLTGTELDGLTPAVLERFKRDEEGRYFVNFKRPNMNSILSDVHSAVVRRKYYIAWDNRLKEKTGPLQYEILRLRRESALILGFPNFSKLKEPERMLTTERVAAFLESLKQPLHRVAQEELNELAELKARHLETLSDEQKDDSSIKAIFRWDNAYYKRQATIEAVQIDTSKVAEYFSFQLILPKLLEIFSLLFGLEFVTLSPKDDGVDTWHEDVQVFAVWNTEDQGREFVGYLYIDPYPRDGKYGHVGVYCMQLGSLKPDGTRQYPAAALMANYPPPTQSRPSLLKYPDVVNCFHELGHAIHNLVGRCTFSRFHGSQVARDFAEVPSRLLENFFWDPNVIRAVSCHYEKPELDIKLPEEQIRDTVATRFNYAASTKLGDLTFSLYDQTVHTTWEATGDNEFELAILNNKIRREVSLLRSLEDLGHGYDGLHGQTHFRAFTGHPSSYYTYLAADAFSTDIFENKFKPLLIKEPLYTLKDIVNDELKAEGRRYRRAILEPGSSNGSEVELIKAYLGRDPDPNAYVEILAAAARKRAAA